MPAIHRDEWSASREQTWCNGTCWMWPEWMMDDSFCVSRLTIIQMRELRFPLHPAEACDIDVQTPAEERDSRSIWSKRLHVVPPPRDRYSEHKVFSYSESSLYDIVILLDIVREVLSLWSTHSFYALGFRVKEFIKMACSCFRRVLEDEWPDVKEPLVALWRLWLSSCNVSLTLWKNRHNLNLF